MVGRLSPYDVECGTQIDAAFAGFQGRDTNRALARVFAAVVHRRTGGIPDGTNNPFGSEGAGWIGFAGLMRDLPGQVVTNETTVFAKTIDGCRVAALLFKEVRSRQCRRRIVPAMRLRGASDRVSQLRSSIDLTGLGTGSRRTHNGGRCSPTPSGSATSRARRELARASEPPACDHIAQAIAAILWRGEHPCGSGSPALRGE